MCWKKKKSTNWPANSKKASMTAVATKMNRRNDIPICRKKLAENGRM